MAKKVVSERLKIIASLKRNIRDSHPCEARTVSIASVAKYEAMTDEQYIDNMMAYYTQWGKARAPKGKRA